MKNSVFDPHLLSILAIVLFSTIEVAGKSIGSGISAYGITAWRFLTGGLLILPIAIREQALRSDRLLLRACPKFFLAGVLNVCISMLFLQLSVYYGKAVLSAVIVSTNTLFVAFFAWLFLREKITALHLIGLTLGLAGLFCIIYGEKELLAGSRDLLSGVLFGLAAALTFAIYTVYSKRLVARHGNLLSLSLTFIFGAVALFAYSAAAGKEVLFSPTLKNVLILLYLSMFVTGIAYIMYFAAVSRIGAGRASLYFFLKPAVAATLAWLIHRERIAPLQLAGIAIIILSLSRNSVLRFAELIKKRKPTGNDFSAKN